VFQCSTRLCARSSSFHSLHHFTLLTLLYYHFTIRFICQTSSISSLNSLSLFLPLTSRSSCSTSLISRLPSIVPQLGCQQTSSLLINLKLNSRSLVFLNSFPKFLILPFHDLQCHNNADKLIFDSSLTFSEHISSVSKSCFLSIRDLRRIRNTLDNSTAQTIATSLIHSKVDY